MMNVKTYDVTQKMGKDILDCMTLLDCTCNTIIPILIKYTVNTRI